MRIKLQVKELLTSLSAEANTNKNPEVKRYLEGRTLLGLASGSLAAKTFWSQTSKKIQALTILIPNKFIVQSVQEIEEALANQKPESKTI